ncbi:MAG TPA: pyridoxamine 5'-phosphate oxidase family protein [Thermoanaerobaculia bacterium]
MSDHYIETLDQLRQLYPPPGPRAVAKQLPRLDRHCRRFIELSPFVVLSTGSGEGFDASPRGGAAGFVRVVDEATLWIPDSPGNHRLDSLANIVASGAAGLLFLIPGVDETLRVNGSAQLCSDPEKLRQFASEIRTPKVIIEISAREVFLHCAKALMRSKLWSDEVRQPRSVLPTMGQMLAEQTGQEAPAETQEQMVARYQRDL